VGLENSHDGRRSYSIGVVEASRVVEVEVDDVVADDEPAANGVVAEGSVVDDVVVDELKAVDRSLMADDSAVGDVSESVRFTA